MTPDLIALLLQLPLPARLALLDAEPNGAGYLVPVGCTSPGSCYVVMRVTPHERKRVQDGAVWLPSNPLAIVEHAARLRFGPSGWFANLSSDDGTEGDYRASVVRHSGENGLAGLGLCPHTAAIALLREVVGC